MLFYQIQHCLQKQIKWKGWRKYNNQVYISTIVKLNILTVAVGGFGLSIKGCTELPNYNMSEGNINIYLQNIHTPRTQWHIHMHTTHTTICTSTHYMFWSNSTFVTMNDFWLQ